MLNLQENLNKGYSIKKDIILIGALLCFALVSFLINYWFVKKITTYDNMYVSYVNHLTVLSQSISKDANQAIDGSLQAFRELKQNRNLFSDILEKLKNGEVDTNGQVLMPASNVNIRTGKLQELEEYWEDVSANIHLISLGEGGLVKLINNFNVINKEKNEIDEQFREIHIISNEKNKIAMKEMVLTQTVNFYQILYNMKELLHGGRNARTIASNLKAFMNDFIIGNKALIKTMSKIEKKGIKGNKDFLEKITVEFENIGKEITLIVDSSSALANLDFAANSIYSSSVELLSKVNVLKQEYLFIAKTRVIGNISTNALIMLSLLLLLLLGYRTHINSRNNYLEVEAEKSKNEKAIQLLVNELIDLANGNLTVNATVTDGILGAIAESINYAINALRRLISIVNQTTEKVSVATKDTKETTKKLAEASSHQASEIVAVTASVNAMASSIENVSKNAHKSKEVAEYSLDTANNGKQIVLNNITGMEKIRQQIQETSKKIKRLGESSQEIGEMVLLIDDIAEQTNILSLNAAIQAAMAGEAGKGFGVVADEVQRLAERSSDATKQISALVKTIQADTNQTVTSMEDTTAQVVQGAKLSEDAGTALNKIENVSNELAMLVKDIALESMQQAETLSIISKTMDIIQSIATDTASGTATTAGSTGMLAELVTDLRNSVAGFLLPKDMRIE